MKPEPLSDRELDQLNDFLMEKSGLENAMDIAMLDGYLTAMVSGPRTILPSEWLPRVWDVVDGRDTPKFKNKAQAQRVYESLMRHMNDIARTLYHAPEQYEPLLMENPNQGDPIPILDEWCFGFMTGVALDQSNWQPLLAKDPKLFEVLTLYGTEDGFETLLAKQYSLEQHKMFAAGLADTVRVIYAFWLRQRQPSPSH
jgi:uncharacterized protein